LWLAGLRGWRVLCYRWLRRDAVYMYLKYARAGLPVLMTTDGSGTWCIAVHISEREFRALGYIPPQEFHIGAEWVRLLLEYTKPVWADNLGTRNAAEAARRILSSLGAL